VRRGREEVGDVRQEWVGFIKGEKWGPITLLKGESLKYLMKDHKVMWEKKIKIVFN
jgi:hypothetical protein